MPATTETIGSALNVLMALADAVKEAGSIPSGHLYAAICGKIDLNGYKSAIETLKRAGVIREQGHLLIWNVTEALVKISIPSLHGQMRVTGRITNRMDNKVEVKTQLHGYHWVNESDLITD